MKIAIYHNLPSGGAKRALYEYVIRLKNKHKLDLYIPSTANEDFLDLRPHVGNVYTYPLKFRSIPLFAKGINILFNLKDLERRIAQDIDSRGYDLVFVNHCQFIQSPYVLRFLKTPTVYYCQEPRRVSYEYNFKKRHFDSLKSSLSNSVLSGQDEENARSATLVLANSYFSMESIYRSYGIEAKVCYLGINTKMFEYKNKLEILEDRSVLTVGAADPVKGFEFLIKSLSQIPNNRRPKLKIISDRWDQGFKERILFFSKSLGVHTRLFQNLSNEKLVNIYLTSNLTLCAAHLEPFGFTPLESMACGTPVVAVKEGGYRETVKIGGLQVDRDPIKFSKAILKLLNNDELRLKMSSQGAKYVADEWNWEKSLKTLEGFFASVTKKNS
jgi:glycosyltransferase involved in cell wall biosynthesis